MNKPSVRKAGSGGRGGTGRLRPGRAALAVGFAFGLAFGLALGAVAYFLDYRATPGGLLSFATRTTGHADIAEDLVWLFSGAFIGAMLAAYGAWRAEKRRAEGLAEEHVLHRTFRVLDGGLAAGTPGEPPGDGESGGTARS